MQDTIPFTMPSRIVAAFSRRTTLPLTLTKLATSGDVWSHCGIVVPGSDEVDERFIIEALMFKGVVKTHIEEWMDRYPTYAFVEYRCPNPQRGERFALEQVGKGYDYLGMIGAPWRLDWEHDGLWYCSELLEAVLKESGLDRWREGKRGVRPMESYLVK